MFEFCSSKLHRTGNFHRKAALHSPVAVIKLLKPCPDKEALACNNSSNSNYSNSSNDSNNSNNGSNSNNNNRANDFTPV